MIAKKSLGELIHDFVSDHEKRSIRPGDWDVLNDLIHKVDVMEADLIEDKDLIKDLKEHIAKLEKNQSVSKQNTEQEK